jgi:hypothetical protein
MNYFQSVRVILRIFKLQIFLWGYLIFIYFRDGPFGLQVKHSCPPLCLDVLKMDQVK